MRYRIILNYIIIIMVMLISFQTSNFLRVKSEPDNDLIITTYQRYTNIDYILDGNLVVSDKLELINCNFKILQDYDYQYSIKILNGGELFMDNSKIESIGSSGKRHKLEVIVEGDGIIRLFSAEIGEDIDIELNNNGNIYGENTRIFGNVILNDNAKAEFIDTTAYSIKANDFSECKIYGVLDVKTIDCAGIPIPLAEVKITNPLTGKIYDTKNTDIYGEARFIVLTDIINKNTYPGSDFVGNYNVSAKYDGYDSSYQHITFPYYTVRDVKIVKYERIYKKIDVEFNKVLIPPMETNYYSIGEDITINDEQDIFIGNGNNVRNSWFVSGSITLVENAVLNIRNTDLHILQEENARYYILLKDNSTLKITNGKISSNYPLNIYLYDNSKLKAKDAVLELNLIGARDTSSIEFENCVIKSNINIRCRNGTYVPTNIIIRDSVIESERLLMESIIYDIENTRFNQPLKFNGNSTAYLTNVVAPDIIVIDNGIAYIYYWLTVSVRDIEGRAIHGCRVVVNHFNATFEETEYLSDFTNNLNSGTVRFKLLSRIIDAKRDLFYGNYKVSAYFINNETFKSNIVTVAMNNNIALNLTFKELIGGPNIITLVALVKPEVVGRDEEVIVAGLAFLDGVERARHCHVKVTIVETNMTWTTMTDENGAYRVSIIAPSERGEYTIRVDATTNHIYGTIEKTLTVDRVEEEAWTYAVTTYMPWTLLGLVISWCILYIVMRKKTKVMMRRVTEF